MLRFEGDEPVWTCREGGRMAPSSRPGTGPSLPVMAVVPDRYFFFYLPEGLAVKSERRLRAATLLQLRHVFPPPGPEQEQGTLTPGPAGMPGFLTHPELAAFWERHREDLERATLVTTPFVLAWQWAQSRGLDAFRIEGNGGGAAPAVFAEGGLRFAVGGLPEPGEAAGAEVLDWTEAALHAGEGGMKWSRLGLPLVRTGSGRLRLRPYVAALIGLTLAFLLVASVQVRHIMLLDQGAEAWQGALDQLYSRVLGPDPGPDPHGSLAYALDRLKGREANTLDLIALLASLSAAAPEALDIEAVAMAPNETTVRGKVGSYDALEAYTAKLQEQGAPFRFTLEQATTTPGGVGFSLKVGY